MALSGHQHCLTPVLAALYVFSQVTPGSTDSPNGSAANLHSTIQFGPDVSVVRITCLYVSVVLLFYFVFLMAIFFFFPS